MTDWWFGVGFPFGRSGCPVGKQAEGWQGSFASACDAVRARGPELPTRRREAACLSRHVHPTYYSMYLHQPTTAQTYSHPPPTSPPLPRAQLRPSCARVGQPRRSAFGRIWSSWAFTCGCRWPAVHDAQSASNALGVGREDEQTYTCTLQTTYALSPTSCFAASDTRRRRATTRPSLHIAMETLAAAITLIIQPIPSPHQHVQRRRANPSPPPNTDQKRQKNEYKFFSLAGN